MSEFKVGDKVRVVSVVEGCEDWGYAIGDVLTVSRVTDPNVWRHETILDVEEGDFDLYAHEVELATEDAPIFEEIKGHGESEARGILQEGITEEQALAARQRAIVKVRKDQLDAAVSALETAKKRYEEVSGEPAQEPVFFLNGSVIADTVKASTGARVVNIEPADYPSIEIDWGDDVGKEVIHDAYNPDAVKAPEHYVNSRIEPIDYMADKLPAYTDGFVAFCVGNSLKYLSRAPHKGAYLQDLKKARQYLDFAIEHEEKKEQE